MLWYNSITSFRAVPSFTNGTNAADKHAASEAAPAAGRGRSAAEARGMNPTATGSYVLLAPCFGGAGWQVLVFSARGQCTFGSAHATRAEAARERRRLVRSLGGMAGRGK